MLPGHTRAYRYVVTCTYRIHYTRTVPFLRNTYLGYRQTIKHRTTNISDVDTYFESVHACNSIAYLLHTITCIPFRHVYGDAACIQQKTM